MAAGRLVYVSDPALDFLGEMRLDLPWAARTMGNGFFRLQALTSIIESGGDFTFDLRELDYELEAGFRFRTAGPVQFAFSLAQTGKEQVDRNGEPLIRTLEVGLQSREFPLLQPQARWRWSVKTGLVVGKRETGADGRFEGEVHYRTDLGRVAWGLDGVLDGLYNRDDASFRADLELGPRFGFLLPGSQRIDFFIHYLRGSNPLGLRLTGVLVGVDLGQAFRPAGPRRPPA
ncbi:MAG: hypothetical protein ACE5ID_00065, partial [Acidobacteriota bacterium]